MHLFIFTETFVTAMRHFGHWLEAGYTPVVSVCKRPRNKQLRAKAAEKYSSCSGCSTLLGDNKTKNLLETLRTTLRCLLANDATKRRQTFLKLCAQLFAACWPMTNMPCGILVIGSKQGTLQLCLYARDHATNNCVQKLQRSTHHAPDAAPFLATTRRKTFLKLCAQLFAACWPMTRQKDDKPS